MMLKSVSSTIRCEALCLAKCRFKKGVQPDHVCVFAAPTNTHADVPKVAKSAALPIAHSAVAHRREKHNEYAALFVAHIGEMHATRTMQEGEG